MAREVIQPGFRIAAVGSVLPDRLVTNDEIAAQIAAAHPEEYALRPTDDKWIKGATGIAERRIINPESGEGTGSLAAAAGRMALELSDVDPKSVEMLILATTTPDDRIPSTATDVQKKLGLENAFAFDINAACSGFVYAVAVADAYMARHGLKRCLAIGADTLSTVTDYSDRVTAPLFADGAGAVLLEATDDDRGLIGTSLESWGSKDELHCPHSELAEDGTMKAGTIKMAEGRPVFEAGIEYMVRTSRTAMEMAQVTPDEVKLVVPHQANLRMMRGVIRKLGIPEEKMAVSIDHTGNSSAATIPIALDEKLETIRLEPGDVVVMTAAGAGMTGGAVVVKF